MHVSDYEVFGPKIVYNSIPQSSSSSATSTCPSHPEEVVRHLLADLVTLMKGELTTLCLDPLTIIVFVLLTPEC